MNLLNSEDVASVILFDLRASEGELQYISTALNRVLQLQDERLHALFTDNDPGIPPSETREFIEDMYQYLVRMLREHSYPEYLPTALKVKSEEAEFNYASIERASKSPAAVGGNQYSPALP
ncbi:MAG: hypothetical protein ACPGWR_31655 [Ardenticatenaceae bacterium]